MSFSLSVSMVPASVLAAGKDSSEGDTQAVQVISSDTESESANTETETKNQETKHHKDKETEIKGGFVPESESQAVIESEAVITEQTPQTESETGQKKGAVGKKVKTAGKITPNGTPNVDYKNENGKYTILEDKAVTLTLSDGASLGEVIVKSGATLTIVLKGTTTNIIGTISGEGKVQFAKTSNGKANLKGSIDVAETTVEGGTLFGSGTIKSTQVSLNGGSIACKVTNDVKSGDLTLKASEFTVEKDAVCTIDNVQLNGADVSMDANTVWSDSNGKAVVYFQPASTVAFSIKAVTFTSSEETTDSITAKEQNYTYEDGNLKKGKSATAYTVKVGADLTTTYGEKLENVDIITVSAAKDYTPEVSLRDYDEAMVTPYGAMLLTSVFASAIACNQTLAIILTHQLCRDAQPSRETTAISLENSAVVVAPLIPWSIAGGVPLASVGAPTVSLCFACFLYLLPLWRLAVEKGAGAGKR